MADPQKQSKAEAVQKAQKAKKQPPVQNPDIFIGGNQDKQKLQDLRTKFWEVRSKLT